jgi:phage baseplate assembly protein W
MSFDLKLINGDLILKNGDLQKVENSEKLVQDILKLCLTTAGSNPIHPWYGSFISRTIIGSAMDTSILVQISKSQLNTALENLKKLQELQVKSFQRVSADEQIAAISNISVIRSQLDPRIFTVKISVLTKGTKPINASFNISAI